MRRAAAVALAVLTAAIAGAGCARGGGAWVEDEVTFDSAGLTIHGSYRHRAGAPDEPAALLISESGPTDRNGDNTVAGPVGNMRQLAEYLSGRGVASLRYDKVGTGATGLGPHAGSPADIGSAVYTGGAEAALRFLAGRPGTEGGRISVYAVGEGTLHAMALAGAQSGPRVHSVALLQPLPARYLDLISARVDTDVAAAVRSGRKTAAQADAVRAAWRSAVAQVRTAGTAPAQLPDGLGAILNPGNVKAVADADAMDPLALAARIPAGTPVLLTCSDSDAQADCAAMEPLRRALAHTALRFVALTGVNHVLRDDPTDSVANYAAAAPLSPQLTAALDGFVTA